MGYYSNFYHPTDGASILYFDRTKSQAMRATFASNSWKLTALAPGGRTIRVARISSLTIFTNLDESVPKLELLTL